MTPETNPSKRPWMAVNMLMTADGKVSGPHHPSLESTPRQTMDPMSAFGSRRDHNRLLRIRATMDAIICGRGTIESGPIDLGTGGRRYESMRAACGLEIHPRKIIVSGSGSLSPDCKVFQNKKAPTLIATTTAGKQLLKATFHLKPWIEVRSFGKESVDLRKLIAWLHEHWNMRRMVLEGGGKLNDAMFRANLVDEIFLTVAPLVYGGTRHSTMSDGKGFTSLPQAASFECTEYHCCDGEMFSTFRKKHTPRP
jgi:5-amino-6-(5-phosphoribosylamino)uracil reductase